MRTNLHKAMVLSACLAPSVAFAEINFNGFASVGAGIFSEDDWEYQGVSDDFSPSPFNRFGLQASSNVNDIISFTGQFLIEGTNDYDVEATWLYMTVKASDSTNIRLGKLRSPLFFYSDFLDVGYAYPWIRPPVETYRMPFDNFEGIDIVNQHAVGSWSGTAQAYYGRFEDEDDSSFLLTDWWGANYSLSNDWLTLRISYNTTTYESLSEDLGALADGLAALGSPESADVFDMVDENADFIGYGFSVDWNNIIAAGEFTQLVADKQTLVSDSDAFYLMIGYRFGDFTPHLTYSVEEQDKDFSAISDLDNAEAISPETAAAARALFGINSDQEAIIAGLRWDFSTSAAFKVEVTTIDQKHEDRDGNLVAFAIDTVF